MIWQFIMPGLGEVEVRSLPTKQDAEMWRVNMYRMHSGNWLYLFKNRLYAQFHFPRGYHRVRVQDHPKTMANVARGMLHFQLVDLDTCNAIVEECNRIETQSDRRRVARDLQWALSQLPEFPPLSRDQRALLKRLVDR